MKILFLHQKLMSFVQRDLELLRRHYAVTEMQTSAGFLDLPRLMVAVRKADVVFCWFGKLHAFWAIIFAKIYGKKIVVVAGGDDVAGDREIGYGLFVHPIKRYFGLFIFRYADLILAVSKCSRQEAIHNAKAQPAKVRLLYHGFKDDIFHPVPGIPKKPVAVTVGRITSETIVKKGIKLFVESANYLPDTHFVVIGPADDDALAVLKGVASANVEFAGPLYGEKLIEAFTGAKVYVQTSIHESFGCSVAEAMLCECIPVVSRRTALPEVVGDCGFYVDELVPEAVAVKVQDALAAPAELGKAARERIMRVFPLEARESGLINAIEFVVRS